MARAVAGRILLAAGSVAVALLVAEAGFRIAGRIQGIDYRLYLKELKNADRLPAELFRADPVLGTALVPNGQALAVTSDFSVLYQTNSKAVRDREYDYARTPGTYRVLALGDSFTFGEGIPYGERFTDIPEQQLDGVEVINTGVPGWGLETELLYLAREGVRYRPDLVVVFLNFVDMVRQRPNLFRDGRIVLPEPDAPSAAQQVEASKQEGETWYLKADDPLFRERGFLLRNSYVLSWLSFRLTLAQMTKTLEQDAAGNWEKKRAARESLESSVGTRIPTTSERSMTVLRKFVELSKEHEFRLMIVNISSWAHLDFAANVDPSVEYHDLAPALIAESRERPILFQYDNHYNAGANALLGREFTAILEPLVRAHAGGAAKGGGGS